MLDCALNLPYDCFYEKIKNFTTESLHEIRKNEKYNN